MLKKWIGSIVILLLIISFFVFFDGDLHQGTYLRVPGLSDVTFEKIMSKDQVPKELLNDLNELDAEGNLTRKVYSFPHHTSIYHTDTLHIVFCGGELFKDQPYNVKINSIFQERAFVITDGFELYYGLKIVEETLEQNIDYINDFSFPIIIYKANKKLTVKEYVGFVKNQEGKELPLSVEPRSGGRPTY